MIVIDDTVNEQLDMLRSVFANVSLICMHV